MFFFSNNNNNNKRCASAEERDGWVRAVRAALLALDRAAASEEGGLTEAGTKGLSHIVSRSAQTDDLVRGEITSSSLPTGVCVLFILRVTG